MLTALTLDRVAHLPDGRVAHVEGTVVDTVRRLKEGDSILGWEGDPNMEVFVDLEACTYDVWTLDVTGQPCIVVDSAPYCDQRLIERVVRADSRRFDVVGRMFAQAEAAEKAKAAEFEEQTEAYIDRLHFALRRDAGQHYGGLTRHNLLVWGGKP